MSMTGGHMRRTLVISLATVGLLAGCGGGSSSASFNPFSWFGKDKAVTVTEDGQQVVVLESLAPGKGYIAFTDTRPLIPDVTEVSIDRLPGGAVVRASGVAPSLGYYDAELVAISDGSDGRLVLQFRARHPAKAPGIGSVHQRTLTVALRLSDDDLSGVREIVVQGANTSRVTRR